jgi:hypothetical protein
VTSIGEFGFGDCPSLTSINVAVGNAHFLSLDGVLFNKNQTEIIKYPQGRVNNSYIIPNGVTHIRANAFINCENLTSITFPDSVTSIGRFAFGNCENLTSVTFRGTRPPIFNDFVFLYCPKLTAMFVPHGSRTAYQAVPQLSGFGFDIVEGGEVSTTAPPTTTTPVTSVTALPTTTTAQTIATTPPTTTTSETTATTPPITNFKIGHVLGNPTITIGDALEILKYLAKLDSVITTGNNRISATNAFDAARIVTPGTGSPTINCALEVLKFLAKLESKVT